MGVYEESHDFFEAELSVATNEAAVPPLIAAMAGIDEKIDSFRCAVVKQLDLGNSLVVGWSAGKDSSVVLTIVLDVISDYKKRGGTVPPFSIIHSDTGIEMIEVSKLAKREILKIENFLIRNDLRAEGSVHIATPNITADYLVGIIGGRSIAIMPDNDAKCSEDLKIQPMNRLKKQVFDSLKKGGAKEVVTVIGTRFDESGARGHAMKSRGESALVPVRDKNGSLVLSPIADFTIHDVFLVFNYAKLGQLNAYSDLQSTLELYGAAAEPGSCSLAAFASVGEKESCGGDTSTARFGCYLCTRVSRDASLESLSASDSKYAYLAPLNALRNYIQDTHYDPGRRNWIGRTTHNDGTITIAANAYSPEHTEELLRLALTVDARERSAAAAIGVEPRFEMITKERLIAIEFNWMKYGYHKGFQACRIYNEVQEGARFEIPEVKRHYKALPDTAPVRVPFVDEFYGCSHTGFRDLDSLTAGLETAQSKAERDDNKYVEQHGGGIESYIDYLKARTSSAGGSYANHLRQKNGHKTPTNKHTAIASYEIVRTDSKMIFDPEGLEMFFGFPEIGIDHYVDKYKDEDGCSPSTGLYDLLRLGVISIRSGQQSELDRIARVSSQIYRYHLRGILSDPRALIAALKDRPNIELPDALKVAANGNRQKALHNKKDQHDMFSAL